MDFTGKKGDGEGEDPAASGKKETGKTHAHAGIKGIVAEICAEKAASDDAQSGDLTGTEPEGARNIDVCQYE